MTDSFGTAKQQAAVFEEIRRAHQSEVAEDYVEMIADLIAATGEARVVDLAERFGVAQPTAAKIVARLQREGLVTSRPYRSVFLTEAGEAMAQHARRRHQIVLDFLRALGVSDAQAEIDAEGVEHHVSEETLAAFARLTEQLRGRN
jgi:DtxR family transcriptional regulator, manganese transport regulator